MSSKHQRPVYLIIFLTLAQIVDGRLIFVEVAKTEKPGEDATSQ